MVFPRFFWRMKIKKVFAVATLSLALMIVYAMFESLKWIFRPQLNLSPISTEDTILADIEKLKQFPEDRDVIFDLPILLWWTKFSTTNGIKTCYDHGDSRDFSCYFTSNRKLKAHPKTSAIFFYGTAFSPTDLPLPRRPNEDWALIHEESPKNNALISQSSVIRMFNHTATFRSASSFPLTLQYLENKDVITDESYLVPLTMKNKLIKEEGLGLVAYVQSSCDTPSGRDEFVQDLMKHVKVDSYGHCLHNKDLPKHLQGPGEMKHPDFLRILAKYKFVLAIENAVCTDYITEKLWKAFQVGAVPIYFGAPNVGDWTPNEPSVIRVDDYGSAKDLADHIKMLNANEEEYLSLLQHKPSLKTNQKKFPDLISNGKLLEALEDRKWGVSESQQMSMGTFVQHFECKVCSRVARNLKMAKMGFGPMPYDANDDHYGCPAPTFESGGTLTSQPSRWWERQWNQAYYESRVLEEFMLDGLDSFTSETFYNRVLELIKADNTKHFSGPQQSQDQDGNL